MLKKKDIAYYAKIIPNCEIYEVCELKIRTVEDGWFVGIEKRDKHTYLLNNSEIGKTVFMDRQDALDKVKAAEKNKKTVSKETYYEEY